MTLATTQTGFAPATERATNALEYGAYAQHEIEEIEARARAEIQQLQRVVDASRAVQENPSNATVWDAFCNASEHTDLGSPNNPRACFLGHRIARQPCSSSIRSLVPTAIRKAWAL